MRAVLEIVQFCFRFFVREKVTINETVRIRDHSSRIRLLHCSKLAINRKNENNLTICWHAKFSYWSKFHVKSLLVRELWQLKISDESETCLQRQRRLVKNSLCNWYKNVAIFNQIFVINHKKGRVHKIGNCFKKRGVSLFHTN